MNKSAGKEGENEKSISINDFSFDVAVFRMRLKGLCPAADGTSGREDQQA